jgi:ubiquinol-cytochrome c reductase iron-sulfur subunit
MSSEQSGDGNGQMEPAGDQASGSEPSRVEHPELQTSDDPRFPVADPGLEEHIPRLTDVSQQAADRAARQVITMFLVVPVLAILFVVTYYTMPDEWVLEVGILHSSAKNVCLGLTLGCGLLLIGLATQQWSRKLMNDHEHVEERHSLPTPPEGRNQALADLNEGIAESGVPRRKMLLASALAAVGVLVAPAIVMLTDLGPVAGAKFRKNVLAETLWAPGVRLVNDVTYAPVKASDLEIGQLVNGVPENLQKLEGTTQYHDQKAKCPIVIVSMPMDDVKIPDSRRDWHVGGVLAYSKICTHVGCPISLWEQQTHHMLCPCHQSTFDLGDSGVVIFGPAARSLPQLPIKQDSEGYLVARSDFTVPVGPSYFERDSRHDFKKGDN